MSGEYLNARTSGNYTNFYDNFVFDKTSLPWNQFGMENFEMAITGNAFLYLIHKIKLIRQTNPDNPKIAINWQENKILQKIIK